MVQGYGAQRRGQRRHRAYKKSRFRVKKPIRSFRDLEVYQRSSKLAAEVMTKIAPLLEGKNCPVKDKLISTCLDIPTSLAVAHSRRFEKGDELKIMEEIMAGCNKVMVYLEQIRDIFVQDIDRALCEDIIKRYTYTRRKIFNLYKAWMRFADRRRKDEG